MAISSGTPPVALPASRRTTARSRLRAAPKASLERLSRWGLVVRGILYFVPGVSALQWALGHHGQPMTQASTIAAIGHQPLGRVLLVVVALGLAGYAAWGVVRALFDPQHRGHGLAGVALRIGYATSAVAYAGLLVATLRLLGGTPVRVTAAQDWSVAVLARPFGGVLVAVIGLCWIFGSGIAQIVTGWHGTFKRDLALERLGRIERGWAITTGRIGLVSRGCVYTIIGVLLVAAAFRVAPDSSTGLEGALIELAHQPFGLTLLGAAGLGLMTFGIYSAMCARWMRMNRPPPAPAGSISRLAPNEDPRP
jgi:hypothetical protein